MAAAEAVKVLGAYGSPFSRRVELALRLKGVPYEYLEQDLANKSELLLEHNPTHKKVPVLVHDGKPVVESLVILEYVEDTWKGGHPLLPGDPHGRAQARFWAKFIDDKCNSAVWMSCWSRGDTQKMFMEQSKENLKLLEAELKGKKFFGGDAIGLVDVAANFLALWAGILQEVNEVSVIDEEKHPELWKWSRDFLSSDIVKGCLPDREVMLDYFRSKKEAILLTKAPVY
ncbi:glutathione S-transferase U8-like [Iris pallida]|uniref:glutathione transferase n=1 Tax=Iris pallida TaxID=29817 RepID=A0AAX6E3Y3_IRIPA|nr:glutathione S-transferase U8-like [Iris pallida]